MSDKPNPPAPPVVSVLVTTYRHAAFIGECLNSVLDQKTGLPFEILLGDDGSTDGTREICEEFARRHPDRIRLFVHDRAHVVTIRGRATGRANFLKLLAAARGRFVIRLDGDDFWTDPAKLDTQARFLLDNPGYSACCHATRVVDGKGRDIGLIGPKFREGSVRELAALKIPHLSSWMCRRPAAPLPDWYRDVPHGDWPFMLLTAAGGKIRCFPQAMTAWRVHGAGIWSSQTKESRALAVLGGIRALARVFDDPAIRAELKRNALRQYLKLGSRLAAQGRARRAAAVRALACRAGRDLWPRDLDWRSAARLARIWIWEARGALSSNTRSRAQRTN